MVALECAIARRLFIAPGTVKVHLSHIFAKLSITTRAELAAQDLTARWRVRHRSLFAPPHPVTPKTIRRRPEGTICMPPPRQPA